MWRGFRTYFSTSTWSSPKALIASRLARRQRGLEVGRRVDDAHALAAAAGAGLDQHRIADRRRPAACRNAGVLVVAVVAGHQRHAGLLHQRLRRRLRAHGADRGGRRADEDDAGRRAGVGEVGVLGQEAVAGMDRLGAGLLRGVEDPVGDAGSDSRAARRADQHRLVGERAHGGRRRRPRNTPRRCAMPRRRAVRMTRQAISPRLAIRILLNIARSRPRVRLRRHCCARRAASPLAVF